MSRLLLFLAWIVAASAFGREEVFELSLRDAEQTAIHASNLLKSYVSDQDAAKSQADAQFENLLPKLSFQAVYQYYGNVPTISLGASPLGNLEIPFGTNSTYSLGPSLSYTIWDTYSTKRSYQALSLVEQARHEDRANAELQVLASLRASYVQVQLGLEELKLINDSMELARAQDHDVMTRFNAGAAARLDVVTSQRSVLSYEIQFKQRQSELSSSLQDLLTLLGDHQTRDLSHPGPQGVPNVRLALKLEPLSQLLAELGQGSIPPPGDNQPQIRSQVLQSESFELNSESQSAKLYPALQLSGGISYLVPDIPNPTAFFQETVAVSLSMPLYLGDPTRHLADQQRSAAESARFRADQLRDNIQRDFGKAREMLESLREQRKLAAQDVTQSEEEARLYFTSYKAGKINLIDVQNANNQALQAKVNAARIDAQTLNQIITLKSLSSKEPQHD